MKFEPTSKDFTPDQMRYIVTLVESTMTAAVLAERERCAKVCEEIHKSDCESDVLAVRCAAAIRGMK